MRRDQLEHAIRTACQIIGHGEVIVVGSQSVLGTFDENQLPAAATMSQEVDILPIVPPRRRSRALPTISRVWPASSPCSSSSTVFASMGSTWARARCPRAGGDDWCVFRTQTPLRRRDIRSSRAGVRSQRTSVWRSCARSVRRIKTLWRRCSTPGWSR